jgi:HEAT repeat protein
LQQLAADAGFQLDVRAALAPLTLWIEHEPLALALPLLVGAQSYRAEWRDVGGEHRLLRLEIAPLPEAPSAAASEPATAPGEVSAALASALDEYVRSGDEALDDDEIARGLDSADAAERVRATLAIDPSSEAEVTRLGSLLASDPDPRVRAAATVGLEDAESHAAVESLLGALGDSNSDVVLEAIDSIEFAGDASSVPRLAPLLAHPDDRVREAAAGAISLLEEPAESGAASPLAQANPR